MKRGEREGNLLESEGLAKKKERGERSVPEVLEEFDTRFRISHMSPVGDVSKESTREEFASDMDQYSTQQYIV